jgi:hypothetical protein
MIRGHANSRNRFRSLRGAAPSNTEEQHGEGQNTILANAIAMGAIRVSFSHPGSHRGRFAGEGWGLFRHGSTLSSGGRKHSCRPY